MTRNTWNRFIYRLWSPFYDWFVSRPFIVRERQRAIRALALQSGEKLLLTGVGTGPDLPLLPEGIEVVGIDLSPAMLNEAEKKVSSLRINVALRVANAEQLPFGDGEFDAVALFLILSVAGNPRRVLEETLRVVRPGGRVVIFDKFLPAEQKPGVIRRILNGVIMRPFGTEINLRCEPLWAGLSCQIMGDEPSLFQGAFRIIRLTRIIPPAE